VSGDSRDGDGATATADAIFDGAVRVWQPRHGYRFATDALLLAEFAHSGLPPGAPARHAFDLGAGSGVVALALLAALPARAPAAARATAVEIDPALAALARRSAADNGLADRLEVRTADVRVLRDLPAGAADLVVSNPPFFAAGRGARAPDPQRAAARHDLLLRPAEVAAAAAHLLCPGGRACVVYAAARASELRDALAAAGLSLHRERLLRPRAGAAPRLVLLEVHAAPAPAAVARDELVLHVRTGAPGGGMSFAPAVERFLRTGAPIVP